MKVVVTIFPFIIFTVASINTFRSDENAVATCLRVHVLTVFASVLD